VQTFKKHVRFITNVLLIVLIVSSIMFNSLISLFSSLRFSYKMTQKEILKFSIDQVQSLLEESYSFDTASLKLFKGNLLLFLLFHY
jgi:alpha-N-acetylglucosamine transferase